VNYLCELKRFHVGELSAYDFTNTIIDDLEEEIAKQENKLTMEKNDETK
jgi:hypothetical protein